VRIAIAVALATFACGHSHGGGPKDGGGDGGGSGDAQIDAPNVRGAVAVHVVNPGDLGTSNHLVCEPGQHVIFIDTDATQTDVTTDGNGDAQASVFPGASVHVICHRLSTSAPPAIDYLVATIEAVEPGDQLVVNEGAMVTGRQSADPTLVGTFTVTYPSYASGAGYWVYNPCQPAASGSTTAVLTITAGCMQPTMDLVAVALNGNTPVAYAEATNVAFTPSGSTAIAGPWHALASVTETVSNAPAFCANTSDPNYPCGFEANRYIPGLHGLFTNGIPGTAVQTALAQYAKAQTIVTTANTQTQTIMQNIDGTLTTYALDLGATLLPWLCTTESASCPPGTPACCVAAAPSFDATNARLTLSVSGTQPIDIFEVDVTYVRANTTVFIWRVFGPIAGDVQLPSLPVADGDVTPRTGDKQSFTHAMVGESDAIAGWRPARQNVFDSLETCEQPTSATSKRLGGTLNRFSRSN
jgi:hypothetical protein